MGRGVQQILLSSGQLPPLYPTTKLVINAQISKYMCINIQPVGLSVAPVANELHVLAVIKERLCKEYCINSDFQPQATVTYTTGTPRLVGTVVYIPVKAVVSIVVRGCGCNAETKLYNEQFVITFAGQTGVPTAVTLTVEGHDVQPAFLNCNCAHGVAINDSLLITITPAA